MNQKLIAALKKYYADKSVMLNDKVWTVTDLVTAFTNENSLMGTVTSTRAAWRNATAAAKAARAVNNKLRTALRQFVRSQYGGNAQVLDDFGYDVVRKPAPSVIGKVASAARAAATRVARGTLGSRKRKAIRSSMTTAQALAAAYAAVAPTTPASSGTPSSGTPSSGTPGTGNAQK